MENTLFSKTLFSFVHQNITTTNKLLMKKLVLVLILFVLYQTSNSQCDKKVTFKCIKGRELKYGAAGQELPIEATLSFENTKVTFTASFNGEIASVEGEITEIVSCQWTDYLKNGKTQYKAYMTKPGQSSEKATIDIESENGATKITLGSDPDTGVRMQLDVAEYVLAEEPLAPAKEQPAEKQKKKRPKSNK